jgi:uncharacterized protein (DUF1800 family)
MASSADQTVFQQGTIMSRDISDISTHTALHVPVVDEKAGNAAVQVLTPLGVAAGVSAFSHSAYAAVTIGATTKPASNKRDAWRFLTQATFGPVDADLLSGATLMRKGYVAWLNEQFALQPAETTYNMAVGNIGGWRYPDQQEADKIGIDLVLSAIWKQFLEGKDQLRQRVAFALSEIFVVSLREPVLGIASLCAASFHDMLVNNAFGNLQTLVSEVCRHPAMGIYLSHMNNKRPEFGPDDKPTRIPDQNFARELMQLFTIGLVKLNLDGTPQLGANGLPVPTYTQRDIEVLSYVFTGWFYDVPGNLDEYWKVRDDAGTPGNTYFWEPMRKPMAAYDATRAGLNQWNLQHATPDDFKKGFGTETPEFLGQTLNTTGSAYQDMMNALNILLSHQNVAPFIAKHMIQRLVTSQPSPAYVKRVATKFKDAKLSLRTLVEAVLLDTEARDMAAIHSNYGKMREPVLRITAAFRALKGIGVRHLSQPSKTVYAIHQSWPTVTEWPAQPTTTLGQGPYQAPSVFNFFRPGYILPGTALTAPEFQAASGVELVGFIQALERSFEVYGGFGLHRWVSSDAELAQLPRPTYAGITFDPGDRHRYGAYFQFHDELAALGQGGLWGQTALLNLIRTKFFGDRTTLPSGLDTQLKAIIAGVNSSTSAQQKYLRVKVCVLTALISPEFVIQK